MGYRNYGSSGAANFAGLYCPHFTTFRNETSEGYIIRILQHFATKRRNITNFVMLFQAVMKFMSILV